MQISIRASDLPGRDGGPSGDFHGYHNIHVGIQRRGRPGELLGLHPGDAVSANWALEATLVRTPAGWDIKGPHIEGRPGGRFICLSWGTVEDTGSFTMLCRAKLMLDAIDPAILDTARRYGGLNARLKLTDSDGRPVCAAVRPPLIDWSASPTG